MEVLSKSNSNQVCSLCGSESYMNITLNVDKRKTIPAMQCKGCRLITNAEKYNLFGEKSEHDLSDDKIKRLESLSYDRFLTLNHFLGDSIFKKGNRVLEISTKTGGFLRYLNAIGWECTGIEDIARYVAIGKEYYNLNILDSGELMNSGFHGRFDLVVNFSLLNAIEDPNVFLQKAYEFLKEDGLVFLQVTVIDLNNYPSCTIYNTNIKNFFSIKIISSFLVKNGFDIKQSLVKGDQSFILAQKTANRFSSDSYKKLFEPIKVSNTKIFDSLKINDFIKKGEKAIKKVLENRKSTELPSWTELIKNKNTKYKFAHLGFHASKNTGDIALFVTVRKQFEYYIGDIDFELYDLHQIVNDSFVEAINKTHGLIIGGGGLFLKDTNANHISGWQWPCSIEMMEKIKVPIFVYAIGYNRFRGQDDFAPYFRENINELFAKSKFIGLRNKGSIVSIKSYLDNDFSDRIFYQPCSTTLMGDYYPKKREIRHYKTIIAFNVAFDRHFLRYGDSNSENRILNSICYVIKKLVDEGNEVVLLNHVIDDKQFDLWLKANGLNVPHIDLMETDMTTMVEIFRSFSLVVGTRGHAQMIPFGLNVPIMSLISHDKLRYFLEDMGIPEKGVDVRESEFEEVLYDKIKIELSHPTDFSVQHEVIRNLTIKNFEFIRQFIDE